MDGATTPTPQSFVTSSMHFHVCDNCHGQGGVWKPPSKKSRLRYKRRLDDTETITDGLPPPIGKLEPCSNCQSSGLVLNSEPVTYKKNMPHVAICGGGIAGLALAVACRHRGIPHTVLERDSHFSQRSQGYGLTLQQASKALKYLGHVDDIIQKDGITSTKHVVHTTDGRVVGEWGLRKWGRPSDKKEPKRQNIHIARQALRYHLLKAADQTRIKWNSRLVEFKEVKGGADLTIQTGDKLSTTTANLIVGCDGIRSQVRQQLVGEDCSPLRYLDCLVVLGILPLTNLDEAVRSNDLLDGATVFQTADGSTRIYMMPYSSTEYMWQLSFPMAEEDSSRISSRGPEALKEEAMARCGTWHSPIPEILSATPVSLVSGYPVYDRALLRPEQLRVSACATLIGDACHPMSPFKGQGANQAMLDAISLANKIYSSCFVKNWSLENALQSFEKEMLERSAVKVLASAEAAKFLHSDVAIQEGNVTRGAANNRINSPDT